MSKHVHVSLPAAMVDEIDLWVSLKTLGYSSRADFVRDACRRLLFELGERTLDALGPEAYMKIFPPDNRIARRDSDEF
jgi:Arc/MetJ-type ribon-helix-helix transcriptional regulator